MKKSASEKFYILMSLILGLVVLAISLYFIFFELFTDDDLNWEQCRQSIYFRSVSPEFKKAGITLVDLKDRVPLMCKTEVVNVDSSDQEEIYRKISDVIAAGWNLYGEGQYDIVPVTFSEKDVYCMVFARVHFSEDSIKEFQKNDLSDFESRKINTRFLNFYKIEKMKNGEGYNDHLPLIIFAEEGSKSAVIPYNVNFYPTEDDLLFVYTTYKNKDVLRQSYYDASLFFSGAIFDKNEMEVEFVKYVGMDKTIGIVKMNDLKKIGCSQFLTIPA